MLLSETITMLITFMRKAVQVRVLAPAVPAPMRSRVILLSATSVLLGIAASFEALQRMV